ncbi:MAG: hypothetical protein IPG49_04340 [Proteobacteria bacterium]|nr:hypothetical protein [Pseudomonadota bacterium]
MLRNYLPLLAMRTTSFAHVATSARSHLTLVRLSAFSIVGNDNNTVTRNIEHAKRRVRPPRVGVRNETRILSRIARPRNAVPMLEPNFSGGAIRCDSEALDQR